MGPAPAQFCLYAPVKSVFICLFISIWIRISWIDARNSLRGGGPWAASLFLHDGAAPRIKLYHPRDTWVARHIVILIVLS